MAEPRLTPPGAEQAMRWMAKAARDLASAVRLLEGEPPYPDTALYHCQQAAEKALKGFLAAQDRPLRRVHDLVLLLDDCAGIDPSFDALAEAAATLTPYGTAFRYPGTTSEPDLAEAQEGLELTRQVLAQVAGRLAAGTPDESP